MSAGDAALHPQMAAAIGRLATATGELGKPQSLEDARRFAVQARRWFNDEPPILASVVERNIALAMMERPYHAERSNDLWVEIYASRELQYHKLMVKARVTPRPFLNLARRKAVPPLNY